MSIISLNLMNSDQRKALFEAWQSQWRLQYFLAVAWSTERHLTSAVWESKGLVIRRSSGAGHLVYGDKDFVLDQLKQGPLLLHESLLPAALLQDSHQSEWHQTDSHQTDSRQTDSLCYEGLHGKQLVKVQKTSRLMRRLSKASVSEDSDSIVSLDANLSIRAMAIEDYSVSKKLYERYMQGSLSVQDFQRAAQQGAYSIGIYNGSEQIAVGHIGFEWQGEAYVYGILVSPEYRGRGLGKAIMAALHREADRRGWHLSLLTDNPIAMALYYQVGYQDAGWMLRLSCE